MGAGGKWLQVVASSHGWVRIVGGNRWAQMPVVGQVASGCGDRQQVVAGSHRWARMGASGYRWLWMGRKQL